MAVLPFATGTHAHNLAIDTEALENLYVEISETGKSIVSLLLRPGLEEIRDYGGLELRGLHVTGDSITRYTTWIVHGSSLIREREGEPPTGVGVLDTSEGPCYIASNASQVMVTDGTDGYIYDENTQQFTKLDSGTHGWTLTSPRWVTYLSTYFIVLDASDGSYNISKTNDGLSWNATDKAFGESDPDGAQMVIASHGELWLFGSQTTEIHYNTGQADFPFAPKLSATLQWGTPAPFSVAPFDNTLAFLGQSKRGGLRVFRMNGYGPERISNATIETAIRGYSVVSDAVGFGFDWEDHAFYMLTFPSEDKSWLFDYGSRQWALISSIHATETQAQTQTMSDAPESGWVLGRRYLGQYAAGRENDILVTDYRGGRVYRVADNGVDGVFPIYVRAVGKTINDMEQWIDHRNFQVVCEQGTGESGDPVGQLRWSNDNARTWSSWYSRRLGPIGEYGRRMRWNRLGRARNRTYEFRITDATPKKIVGMVLNGGP